MADTRVAGLLRRIQDRSRAGAGLAVEHNVLILWQVGPRLSGQDPALRDEDGTINIHDAVLARFTDIHQFKVPLPDTRSASIRASSVAVTVWSWSVAEMGVTPQKAS